MSEKHRCDWGRWAGFAAAALGIVTSLQALAGFNGSADFAYIGLLPAAWLLSHVWMRPDSVRRTLGVVLGIGLFLSTLAFWAIMGDATSSEAAEDAAQAKLLIVNAVLLFFAGPVLVAASVRGRPKPIIESTLPPLPPVLTDAPKLRPRPTFSPASSGRRRCPQCASALGLSSLCNNCGHGMAPTPRNERDLSPDGYPA